MLRLTKNVSSILIVTLATMSLTACDSSRQTAEEKFNCADFVLTNEDAVVSTWSSEWFMPKNLSESLVALDDWLTEPQKRYLQCEDIGILHANIHFGLALLIRNSWDLHMASPLGAALGSIGLHHPDDMSNFIALEFISRLRSEQ